MKYLLLISLIFLIGCSDHEDGQCKSHLETCVLVQSAWQLQQLDSQCKVLAECMKMPYEIVNIAGQLSNPYACSIGKTEDGYRRSKYFYPKAEIQFKEVVFDRLEDSIAVCEMMTKTGRYSKKYYLEMEEAFKEMDKELEAKKKKRAQLQIVPQVKIRVVK